jgi:hypothetical protein
MKYTTQQIEEMKEMLIDDAMSSIQDGYFDAETIAREGFVGYDDRDDDRIILEFENSYGGDYFEVEEEKDHKNNLYGEEI